MNVGNFGSCPVCFIIYIGQRFDIWSLTRFHRIGHIACKDVVYITTSLHLLTTRLYQVLEKI